VVRIAAPQWVLHDSQMVDFVHSVLCDQ